MSAGTVAVLGVVAAVLPIASAGLKVLLGIRREIRDGHQLGLDNSKRLTRLEIKSTETGRKVTETGAAVRSIKTTVENGEA